MPSLYTSLTPPARDPTNSWQAAPLRRGEGRLQQTMKLLRLATRRRAVLGATSLVFDESFSHFDPEAGLSWACACERVNVHMCEARAVEQ